LAIKKRDLLNK